MCEYEMSSRPQHDPKWHHGILASVLTSVIGLHGASVSTAISNGMAADTVSISTVAQHWEWAGPRSGARQRSPYNDWPVVNESRWPFWLVLKVADGGRWVEEERPFLSITQRCYIAPQSLCNGY